MALYDVVSFEGSSSDWLLYKFIGTEFNVNSKLIVTTSQVAILVHNGHIEKICEEGTYKLDTELLPFISGMVKAVHSGKSPYKMEVYFINKRLKLDLLWGTTDAIKILDPVYQIQLNIIFRGQLAVRLSNYQFFFETLVGSLIQGNFISFEIIKRYFRGIMNQRLKKIISSFMLDNKVSFYEINPRIDEIQKALEVSLTEDFIKFGFNLVNLSIESINVPDSDLEALNDILIRRAEFEQLGDNRYRTSRGYDVLEKGASNQGSAGQMMGVGLGMGMANQATGSMSSIIPQASTNETKTFECPNCDSQIPKGTKFCPECGIKIVVECSNGHKVPEGYHFCNECGESLYKKETKE